MGCIVQADGPTRGAVGGIIQGKQTMRKILIRFMYFPVALLVIGLASATTYADTVQLTITGTGTATWGLRLHLSLLLHS